MLRFLADENFNNDILRGVAAQADPVDVVRVQDVGLSGADDVTVLEWCVEHDRILLTHDVRTIPAAVSDLFDRGLRMRGVFIVRRAVPAQRAIEEIVLLSACSLEGEWQGATAFLPL
jgi:hypothetical protein